jgi:hypothetical protein
MTQLANMGGDTAADSETSGTGETVAPKPHVLTDAEGPLSRDELVQIDAWWRRELPGGRPDIPPGQSLAVRTADGRAHQAAAAGTFRHGPGSEPGVSARQQADRPQGP